MAARKFALAVALAASAGLLLAGCAGVVPGSPAATDVTPVKPQVVRTVTATPPVTVIVAAKPKATATPAPTVTVTQQPPVTVTQQVAPIVVAPQPDPTTVYQYSPAYTSVYGLPAGLLCRDLNNMGYDYAGAIAYWNYHGHPAMMDIDHNGIPCETVY